MMKSLWMSCSYCFKWRSGELEHKGREGQVLAKVMEDEGDNSKHQQQEDEESEETFQQGGAFLLKRWSEGCRL